MKEFSQKMISRTTEIEKQVDTLVHEAKVRALSLSLSLSLCGVHTHMCMCAHMRSCMC